MNLEVIVDGASRFAVYVEELTKMSPIIGLGADLRAVRQLLCGAPLNTAGETMFDSWSRWRPSLQT